MDFQPIISEFVQAVVGIVSVAGVTLFFQLKKYVLSLIKDKLLRRAAEEGFAIAETSMAGQKGTEKLNGAIEYANKRLANTGIKMDPVVIRGAIEKAVLKHKAQAAAQTGATPDTPADQSQQASMPDHVQQLLAAISAYAMAENQVTSAPQQAASTPPAPAQASTESPAPMPSPTPTTTPTTWA
ncbi:phage holin, LLH family [Paenibacillus elgii]|uniref:phage holin, LLH family n=1 Tax=Paenibacillus elgii TaxID=189691 RepID=UPI0013D885EB|nr:phage holin, LLH family [Paenibacillus elgii]